MLELHRQAEVEGRLAPLDVTNEEDALAGQVIETLTGGHDGKAKTEGALIGSELRSGRVNHQKAKTIRFTAGNRLRDYTTFLRTVDELGYTPEVIRAALIFHYEQLQYEELGSEGHCILMDIQTAVATCDTRTRQVVALLANGYGPQEAGAVLGLNGSRLVSKTMRDLGKLLEGRG